MNTAPEVQQIARLAWASMNRPVSVLDRLTGKQPMPPEIAVDMVQDVTDDREAAIIAIVAVAADELDALRPTVNFGWNALTMASVAVQYLRCLDISNAEETTGRVSNMTAFPAVGNLMVCEEYRQWALKARHTIGRCREVCQLWPASDDKEQGCIA